MAAIASKQKQLVWIESDSHDIIRKNINNTYSLLDAFIGQQAA